MNWARVLFLLGKHHLWHQAPSCNKVLLTLTCYWICMKMELSTLWSQQRRTHQVCQETSLRVSQRNRKSIQDQEHTFMINWCKTRWRHSASKYAKDTRWILSEMEMWDLSIRSSLTRRASSRLTSIMEWSPSKTKKWWRNDSHSRRPVSYTERCRTWNQMQSSSHM